MTSIQVYNQHGEAIGAMELPGFFETRWNADLVHQIAVSEAANRRPRVAHAKGRGEVRGGGRKPWRQKGTGRARHGSIRSPLWKGGGVTHGPLKERVFSQKVNRKMAARALAIALARKVRDHELLVVDALHFPDGKTKDAAQTFHKLARLKEYADVNSKEHRILVLLSETNALDRRALRNLPFVTVDEARNANLLEVLNHKYIVIPRSSIAVLEKRLSI